MCLFLGTEALGEHAGLTVLDGTSTDDTLMDSAGNAHTGLHVELGESEALVIDGGVLSNITSRGGVEHVTDDEALDGLILRGEAAAVGAVGGSGTSTRMLGTSVISTLASHFRKGSFLFLLEVKKEKEGTLFAHFFFFQKSQKKIVVFIC